MRITVKSICSAMAVACLLGCSATKYVAVPQVRYRDSLVSHTEYVHDSVYQYLTRGDSVINNVRVDTLFRDRLRTMYKGDYTLLRDTVSQPYPVVKTVEVNRLTTLQKIPFWLGVAVILCAAGYILWKTNILGLIKKL